MLERAEKIVFFLLVFFIASQVGLHFWPDFSYIHGIRIDYLSPTLYLLDILIFLLFVLFAIRTKFKKINFPQTRNPFTRSLLALFILSLFWNLFNVKSPGAHIFGIVKLAEFTFLGFYVAYSFRKEYIRTFIEVLSLSAIVSGTLAIWQYSSQSSIGGFWYYFGERTFTSTTIGISTVNLNEQLLRAYAAFPHPNVLAYFLFIAIVFAALRFSFERNIYPKIFLGSTILVSATAMLFTFSRISMLLLILFSFYVIYSKIKSNFMRFGFIFLLFTGLIIFPWTTDFLFRGIDFRLELLRQAVQIFAVNPYLGIGFHNFFIHQAPLIRDVTPILFQPPHNIYVLSLLSLGLFGWWIFPTLLINAIRVLFDKIKSKNKEISAFYKSTLIVLFGILIVGMFDHFFLTLEQGQIILALTLGLALTKLKD